MPRSSPNTDDDVFEVELEPQSSSFSPHEPSPRTFHLGPVYLIVLGSVLIFGLTMVPGAEDRPVSLVPVATLPEPAVATTAPALPAISEATLAGDTFELLPVVWPDNTTSVVGPAVFQDHIWLIASSPSVGRLTVFQSEDGTGWRQVGQIIGEPGTVKIHDLESFGGSLVALGTIANESSPAAAYGYPDQVVIWRSPNGAKWVETIIVPYDSENWHPQLTLATDDRSLLIGGSEVAAIGQLIDETIPLELSSSVMEGRLDVVLNSGSVSTISVMAPPGIEVFRSDTLVSLTTDHRSIVYLSQDSRIWEEVEVDPTLITWSGLLARPGRGFLARNSSGEMYSTVDGTGWGRNRTIPPAAYARWGEWLVGVQVLPWADQLMVGAGTDFAGVQQPAGEPPIWSETGEMAGGPAGLVSVVPNYLGPAPTLSVTSDSQQFTLRANMFSISTGGSDTASVFFHQLPGSYDPATDEVTIELSSAGDHVVVDLTDLQGLRDRAGGVWKTNVFASPDALSWARSDVILNSPFVEVLGPLPDGFLIAARTGNDPDAALELYRTGPLPEGMDR